MTAIAIPKIEFPHIWVPKLPSWRDLARLLHLRKSPGSGHMMKNAGGHLLNGCAFVSDVPCTDCLAAEPGATVTVSGSCTYYNGTYDFWFSNPGGPPCTWVLLHQNATHPLNDLRLQCIVKHWEPGVWTIWLTTDGVSIPGYYTVDPDYENITCQGGQLVGNATLPGDNGCTGTAAVTLT
ncbi:hypothetical protein LCGC14_0297540 [marine sediment metagenome]|uniref:Uncharacterized protein n=1 Tax=marine sediment metagenome TaxID=412755 RepID=A0A0F9WCG5_9ZZZZ